MNNDQENFQYTDFDGDSHALDQKDLKQITCSHIEYREHENGDMICDACGATQDDGANYEYK